MTFVLVHGAWAGAWCWERVAPELEARGHRVVAVDLPCEDPAATFETYADVVVRALDSVGGEQRVVVGHSLGGLTIPLVAARRPVRRLVYLCAFVPIPGCSFAEQLGMEPDTLLPEYSVGVSEPDQAGRARWVDEGIARSVLFADCTAEDAKAAFERLRPQAATPYAEPCRLREFPLIPTTYIVCSEDRGTSFARVGTTGANVTAFTDTGLASRTSYRYRARSYNGAAVSAPCNAVTMWTQYERELLDAFDARQPAAAGRYLDAREAMDAA